MSKVHTFIGPTKATTAAQRLLGHQAPHLHVLSQAGTPVSSSILPNCTPGLVLPTLFFTTVFMLLLLISSDDIINTHRRVSHFLFTQSKLRLCSPNIQTEKCAKGPSDITSRKNLKKQTRHLTDATDELEMCKSYKKNQKHSYYFRTLHNKSTRQQNCLINTGGGGRAHPEAAMSPGPSRGEWL